MSTCKECRRWRSQFGKTEGQVQSGECTRYGANGVFHSLPLTWADNGACPDFERKDDWALEAARKIRGVMQPGCSCIGGIPSEYAWDVYYERVANLIREERARDVLEGICSSNSVSRGEVK